MEEQTLNTLMESLRDAQRFYLKALAARDDAIAEISAHGFDRAAVSLALEMIEADPKAEYSKLVQASELMRATRGDTQIEFIACVETPYRKDREAQAKAYQAGRDAALAGERCQSPYENGICHRQWVKGWKEAKSSRAA